ncbi:endolytic transglycosylase MltG [bacterium]|nr:endolytic transglycosylase MltG [bacterium]
MRRLVVVALVAMVLGLAVAATLIWRAYTAPTDAPAARVEVVRGATLGDVARDLTARGVLHHRRVFLLAARLGGRDRTLPVGTFRIPAGASPRDILEILLEAPPEPVVVTLPEGLEASTMAGLVADSLGLDLAAILAVADSLVRARSGELMTDDERARLAMVIDSGPRPDGRPLHWCEGYLAPDTYHFAEGSDALAVATAMVDLQVGRLAEARARGRSPHAVLTLAALVEAEARRDDERARIAAVYHNRLARGMRLEADPTVAFWLGKRGERLLYRDLEIDSPYNTYRRSGLPPAPVLAPGAASIAAAAAPDADCRALYFVADGDGGHVFSETLAAHNRAVARYRELMRERRR